MSDLIDRQAAIKEFNCCELTPDGGIDANYAIDFLKQLPSAQSEIIRCKDCLWHGVCRFEQGLGSDGYCSKAERRTDGTNAHSDIG